MLHRRDASSMNAANESPAELPSRGIIGGAEPPVSRTGAFLRVGTPGLPTLLSCRDPISLP